MKYILIAYLLGNTCA